MQKRKTWLLALAMLSIAFPALAHAFLERSVPAAGGTLTEPPHQIVLSFTENVEAAFSTIEVRDAKGATVTVGPSRSPAGNRRQLVVDLPALAGGEYTVTWHATSVDTHKTEGSYRFTVK